MNLKEMHGRMQNTRDFNSEENLILLLTLGYRIVTIRLMILMQKKNELPGNTFALHDNQDY